MRNCQADIFPILYSMQALELIDCIHRPLCKDNLSFDVKNKNQCAAAGF